MTNLNDTSDVAKLATLVGKTITLTDDIGEWQGDVYGFKMRFTDGSSVEFRVTTDESISVELGSTHG